VVRLPRREALRRAHPARGGEDFAYHRFIEGARSGGHADVARQYREAFEQHLAEDLENCTHGMAVQ
jgi:hypothetical protein